MEAAIVCHTVAFNAVSGVEQPGGQRKNFPRLDSDELAFQDVWIVRWPS